jgi:hypothetical protein
MGIEPGWRCPYGAPGDRLWVREKWRPVARGATPGDYEAGFVTYGTHYAADNEVVWQPRVTIIRTPTAVPPLHLRDVEPKWKPGIHMPHMATRLKLEVTGVRVERLQAISEEDALAEGTAGVAPEDTFDSARDEFTAVWDRINGARSPWSSNPWVWVVEFRRLDAEERPP